MVAAGPVPSDVEFAPDVGRQLVLTPDDLELDVVHEQVVELEPQIPLEQTHQNGALGGRALPVLDGERVERQHVETEAGGGLHDVAHGIDSSAVAIDTRQMPLSGPPAVPIHDHRNMGRQPSKVDLSGKRFFPRTGGHPGQ